VRVTVQIDDDRSSETLRPTAGQPGSPPDSGDVTAAQPSPELAARAARIGAISAGAAPSGPPDSPGAPGYLPTSPAAPPAGTGAPTDLTSTDFSAGPAAGDDEATGTRTQP
jgi:hypothetical protein